MTRHAAIVALCIGAAALLTEPLHAASDLDFVYIKLSQPTRLSLTADDSGTVDFPYGAPVQSSAAAPAPTGGTAIIIDKAGVNKLWTVDYRINIAGKAVPVVASETNCLIFENTTTGSKMILTASGNLYQREGNLFSAENYLGDFVREQAFATGGLKDYLNFGDGRIEYSGSSENAKFYYKDHLGSTRAVIDENGATLVEGSRYSAYGEMTPVAYTGRTPPTSGTETYANDKFGGTELDADGAINGATGVKLNHFWFRDYDPETGLWTRPDPLGEFWNSYSYVGGDPVNFVDPLGLMTCSGKDSDQDGICDENEAREPVNGVGEKYICGYDGRGQPLWCVGEVNGPSIRDRLNAEKNDESDQTPECRQIGGCPAGTTINSNGLLVSTNKEEFTPPPPDPPPAPSGPPPAPAPVGSSTPFVQPSAPAVRPVDPTQQVAVAPTGPPQGGAETGGGQQGGTRENPFKEPGWETAGKVIETAGQIVEEHKQTLQSTVKATEAARSRSTVAAIKILRGNTFGRLGKAIGVAETVGRNLGVLGAAVGMADVIYNGGNARNMTSLAVTGGVMAIGLASAPVAIGAGLGYFAVDIILEATTGKGVADYAKGAVLGVIGSMYGPTKRD